MKRFWGACPVGLALSVGLGFGGGAQASCSIREVTGVNFGRYDPTGTEPTLSMGSITLCCEQLAPEEFVSVELGMGTFNQGTKRAMLQGGASLLYNLYMDSARSQLWGDGFEGTSHYGPVHPASGSCTSIPVHGQMPARQTVPSGSYSDTLTVTLSF